MLEIIAHTAVITLVVCVTVFLFSLVTMKYWWWYLKLDLFLFWLSNIATRQQNLRLTHKNQGRKMWRQIYEHLDLNQRQN